MLGSAQGDVTEGVARLRTEMAEHFAALRKRLWLMAVGIVVLTVTLIKLIP